MKRPESMPFWAYRTSLAKLNQRIATHLSGSLIYSGHKPYIAAEYDIRVKPLAQAIRLAFA